jgi:threonylcarbamoyladenosine tRNA methylthiotransferase MtaB
MRFAIVTLGCKVNHYEGQRIRQGLIHAGHSEQPFSEPGADVYIINTCTITHKADADGRRLIRRALSSGCRVIVTGCQAVVYPDDIRKVSREVDVVRPENLSQVLDIDLPRFISGFGSQNRAFVKVQQGCDRYCTYCIVPMARGTPVSRPWQDVVTEVRALVAGGYHEVVLTGINIGLYEGGLTRLIRKILHHTAIARVRVSSVEPWTVEDSLIDLAALDPRVCSHLHLSLQHGSDRVLKAMGRPYTAASVRSLVARIRDTSPSMAIGADIIAGFPGEDEGDFEETYALIEGMDIAYLHVFTFSARPGTAAASLPDRPGDDAVRQRSSRLRELSRRKRRDFAESRVGSAEEVLVTASCSGGFSGISSNYLTVVARGDAAPGSLVKVRLVGHDGSTLQGELLG